MADPTLQENGPTSASSMHSGEVSGKNIVRALKSVDDSFSMLKPGRDLDDRLADLLDGTAAPPQRGVSPRVVAAGALAIGAAVLAVALLVPRGGNDDVAKLAPPPPPAPAPTFAPTIAPPVTPTPTPTPTLTPTPAPPSTVAKADALPPVRGERVEVAVDVRFVDVPLGQLEVRAPSIVDVDKDGAVVVRGSARLLQHGKATRTLTKGDTIAWKTPKPAAPTTPPLKLEDDEVQQTLTRARSLQARGSYAAAADVLGDLLAKKPSARVVDTVSYERASLLAKARDIADACSVLAEHAKKFPHSENAADVAAARARLSCK